MVIYNVKQDKIEEILQNMTKVLDNIKPVLFKSKTEILQHSVYMLAIERAFHIAIESMIDVGNYIIDGFIMRDPGSYVDIIEILEDEQVVSKEVAGKLKKIVPFRKALVQEYTNFSFEDVYQIFLKEFSTLYQFGDYIRSYLAKELN